MSIFGTYFVRTLLELEGWPREKNILSKAVYDTLIVDSVIDQMLVWGTSLGAGRTKLSLKILAEIHKDKDWDGDDAPTIINVIKSSRENWDKLPEGSPSEVIQPTRLTRHFGKSMPSKYIEDKTVMSALEQFFQESVILGLGNPDHFKIWYNNDSARRKSSLQDYKRSGLDVEAPPPLDEWFDKCESIIKDYEHHFHPMPEIPEKLFADAKSVGINIEWEH
jgi:hypothetical protein